MAETKKEQKENVEIRFKPCIKDLIEMWVGCDYKLEDGLFVFEERYTPRDFAYLYNTKMLTIEQPVSTESAQTALDAYAQSGYLLRTFNPATGDAQYTRNPFIAFSGVIKREIELPQPPDDSLLTGDLVAGTEPLCEACRRRILPSSNRKLVTCIWCGRVWHKKCVHRPQKGTFILCESCSAVPESERWTPRAGVVGLPRCSELFCANAVIQAVVATVPTVVKTVLMPNHARPQALINMLHTLFSYMVCEQRGAGDGKTRAEAGRALDGYLHSEKRMAGSNAFKDTRSFLAEIVEQMYNAVDSVKDAFDGQVVKYCTCEGGHESATVEPFKVCFDVPNVDRSEASINSILKIASLTEKEEKKMCPECGKEANFRISERIVKAPKVLALCFQKTFKIAKKDVMNRNILGDLLSSAINKSSKYVLTAIIVNNNIQFIFNKYVFKFRIQQQRHHHHHHHHCHWNMKVFQ